MGWYGRGHIYLSRRKRIVPCPMGSNAPPVIINGEIRIFIYNLQSVIVLRSIKGNICGNICSLLSTLFKKTSAELDTRGRNSPVSLVYEYFLLFPRTPSDLDMTTSIDLSLPRNPASILSVKVRARSLHRALVFCSIFESVRDRVFLSARAVE